MNRWRKFAAIVSGAALAASGLTINPAVAADSAGSGLEVWGKNSVMHYPGDDGAWIKVFDSSVKNSWLGFKTEGQLEALPGTSSALANIPAEVSDGTVVDANVAYSVAAWAVLADGTVYKWGGQRGNTIADGHWTAAQLGGKAVTVSQGVSSSNIKLDNGKAVNVSSFGIVPVMNGDAAVTGVKQISNTNMLLDDGTVGTIDSAGSFSVIIPANAADPVIDISGKYAVTAAGIVYYYDGGGYHEETNFPADQLDGSHAVRAIWAKGTSSAVLTSTGRVIEWNPTGDPSDPNYQVPDVVAQGTVLAMPSSPSNTFAVLLTPGDASNPIAVQDKPTVTGTAQVGQSLTGVPATFTGSPDSITSQWWYGDNGVPVIPGTDELVVTSAMVGETITYKTTATKAGEDDVVSTSDPTAEVIAGAITNTTPPSITGTPQVGSELSTDSGVWGPADVALSYQWLRGTDDITGADSDSYTPVAADVGEKLSVKVTATKAGYTTLSKTSAQTDEVAAAPQHDIANTALPTITGTPKVGETLDADGGTWDPSTVGLAYQWLRDGAVIDNQTGTSYTLVGADADAKISVRVTATKDDYNSLTKTSAKTDTVAKAAITNTTLPSVDGTPKVGEALTADDGAWDPATVGLTREWLRDGAVIAGQTGSSYTLVTADVDAKISVRVTAAQDGYTTLTKTSDETATVKNIDLAATSIPVISGTPQVGKKLTGTPAQFNDTSNAVTVTNKWLADGVAISGAADTSFTLTADQVDKTITLESTAKRGDDSVDSTSAAFGPVQAADIPLAVSKQAKADGTPKVGQTLTGTPAEFTGTPTPTVTNQWLAGGVAISGADGTTFKVTKDQVGKNITFKSTATNDNGELSSVSDPVGPVTALLASSQDAKVSGTAKVGKTLTGTPAEFAGGTGAITITNQWLADGTVIDGADGTTLVLTADQVGKKITFKSTAKAGDETATSESDATAKVVAADDDSNPGDGDGNGDGGTTPPDETPDNSTGTEGDIQVLPGGTVAPGQEIAVVVGEDYAGQDVTAWLFSDPLKLGTFTVKDNGRIAITLPANVPLGKHRIAVYDNDGQLIGWQTVTIAKASAGGNGAGNGPVTPVSGSAGLPNTGADAPIILVPLGLLMLLGGGVFVMAARRKES